MNAKSKIVGFFLSNYREMCKPSKQKTISKLDGKICEGLMVPDAWNEENWPGIEFVITNPEADSETYVADIESQVKDGLKRREQELMRHLLGTGSHARTKDDLELIKLVTKEGKISVTLHNLVNWLEWRKVGRKPADPKEAVVKDAKKAMEKGTMSKKELIALIEAEIPDDPK